MTDLFSGVPEPVRPSRWERAAPRIERAIRLLIGGRPASRIRRKALWVTLGASIVLQWEAVALVALLLLALTDDEYVVGNTAIIGARRVDWADDNG